MTREEKVNFLQQYLDMEPEIIRLQNEMDRWRSIAERCTPVMGVTGAGGGSDKLQSAIDEIDELQKQLAVKLTTAIQVRKSVVLTIQSIPEIRYRTMLNLKYLEGKTFEQIGNIMNMSKRQLIRWHENILMTLNVTFSA